MTTITLITLALAIIATMALIEIVRLRRELADYPGRNRKTGRYAPRNGPKSARKGTTQRED